MLLRIRSAHLAMVRDSWVFIGGAAKTEIFLRGLQLREKSRSWQGLLEYKKKIRGNYAFLRDNPASIWEKMPYTVLYFDAF